jgi:RHS repeat-associated protein
MNNRRALKLLPILLILTAALLGNWNTARADVGFVVTSNYWVDYRSGSFSSPDAAAEDIIREYSRRRGGVVEDYVGCNNDFSPITGGVDNQSQQLAIREQYLSQNGPAWTSCFGSTFYITDRICPIAQLAAWGTYGQPAACKNVSPLVCPQGAGSDGSTCQATCPANLPTGYVGMCAAPSPAPKNIASSCPACDQTPFPIRHGTGWKYLQETILRTPSLSLQLTYNSAPMNLLPRTMHPFGTGWSHNYGVGVWLIANNVAVTLRPDGKFHQFTPPASGNVYISDADVPDTLTQLVSGSTLTGWQYRRASDEAIEQYDADGKLLSITARNSQVTTITYSTGSTPPSIAPRADLPITVTDPFGRSLNFTYDASARVVGATDAAGNAYSFAYDEASSVVLSGQPLGNNLTSVTFPDTRKRTYFYNEQANTANTNLPNALTGITDENNSRYATYQYDTAGRAVHEEHAGGVDGYTVTYNADGTRVIADPLGTAHTYGYQTVQRVTKTTSITGPVCPACGPAGLTYDTNGFRASVTDWNGNLTTYLRQDPNARLDLETSRTEASGSAQARTITIQWHASFRLPTLITEPGRTTGFTYDSAGNALTRTVTDTASSRARTWTYTYDSKGRVLTAKGPRTDVSELTTYTYYSDTDPDLGKRGNLATISNALSQVTLITSYDSNGRPLTIVDPNALTTTLAYHPRGWLASRNVGGETTTYTYDFAGQLTKVTLPDSSFLQYTYDAAHRVTQIQDNLGNRIVYTLDAMGNRTQEDVRDPANTLAQTRSRVYSSLNRLFKDIGGVSPATEITQYGYDNQGNRTTLTDPLNHVTTNGYDALNRLKQVTDPGTGVTQYGLNPLDQLTAVTDPRNNATTYTVDALGNLNTQASPDSGATTNTYDAAGNLLTARDAKGQTTSYAYDALNRVTSATYQDGSKVSYGYDAGINGKGRLSSIVENAPGGALQTQVLYVYNQKGRVTSEARIIGTQAYLTQYGYDSAGRLNSVTYPSSLQLAYGFDAAGRVSQIMATPSGGAAQTLVSGITYQPFGTAKGWSFGNSQTYARSLDLDGRIASFTLASQAQTLAFDAASRITSSSYFPIPTQSVSYGYDVLDRLSSTLTPSTNYGFTYDANGNRTSKTVGATTWTYAYPATSNRLSSITSGGTLALTYDANGSITGGGGIIVATYDARGRLVALQQSLRGPVTYGLNALGQRYRKTVAGTTTLFLYDKAGKLIAETSDAGLTYIQYVWLGDTPVAVIKPGSSVNYIHADHLDTPRLIANQAGQSVWRWNNDDPFGGNVANENPSGLGAFTFNLRYPGQYFDAETNQHYNLYRDYSPEIGRYVESDPVGLLGGINTYGYGRQNPISRIDPSGLFDITYSFAFHLPIYPGIAVGPNVSSSVINYSNDSSAPLVSHPTTVDVAVGVVADIGVSAGLSDLSGTGGQCASPYSINLGFGTRGGVQITPRVSLDPNKSIFNPLRYIDGISFGLGAGFSTPVNVSRPFQ